MKNAVGFYFFVLYLFFLFVCFFNKKHYIIVNTPDVVMLSIFLKKKAENVAWNIKRCEILVRSAEFSLGLLLMEKTGDGLHFREDNLSQQLLISQWMQLKHLLRIYVKILKGVGASYIHIFSYCRQVISPPLKVWAGKIIWLDFRWCKQ